MKTVNKSLETYLETEKKITSCDLYELVLDNGNKYYYADTDIDISFGGHTYLHNALLIKRQQVKIHDRVVVDTMTVTVQADKNDKLEGLPFLQAAHSGVLDRAKLYLRRCFFRDQSVVGAIDLFGGNVEVKSAGGIKIELSVKAETQGLNMEFPVRRYYPQGSYTTNGDGVIYSKETDAATLIAPFVPRREVLI